MRSATVIGFVAGGGIGFFVLETIRMGGYQQYAAALWAVAVVIIIVDYISSRWRFNILKDQPKSVDKLPTWKRVRNIILCTPWYCGLPVLLGNHQDRSIQVIEPGSDLWSLAERLHLDRCVCKSGRQRRPRTDHHHDAGLHGNHPGWHY